MPIFSIVRYGTKCFAGVLILQFDYFPTQGLILFPAYSPKYETVIGGLLNLALLAVVEVTALKM